MEIIDATSGMLMPDQLKKIVSALQQKQSIVFPTDTSYGLGVDATDSEAIEEVFAIKARDAKNPIHMIVANLEMAKKYAEISDTAEKLCYDFFPGPITFLLPRKKTIPDNLVAGLSTVGIRIPNEKISHHIVSEFQKPITATSANISGGADPYNIKQIKHQFESQSKQPTLVIDAGSLVVRNPSTIIQINTDDTLTLVRKGPISFKKVQQAVERIKKGT